MTETPRKDERTEPGETGKPVAPGESAAPAVGHLSYLHAGVLVTAALFFGAAAGAFLSPVFQTAWNGGSELGKAASVTGDKATASASSPKAGRSQTRDPSRLGASASQASTGDAKMSPVRLDAEDLLESTVYVRVGDRHGVGFVIGESGDVVTNEHVVAGARSATVSYADGAVSKLTVLGSDEVTDIALLDGPRRGRGIALLDREPMLGEAVRLFSARSAFERSIISGTVAAQHRSAVAARRYYDDLILLDSRVTQGMSGGPVVDATGDVIGMLTLMSETNDDVPGGFALPASRVTSVVESLARGVRPVHPFIGVQVSEGPADSRGVMVTSVLDGGPAHQSGVRAGDHVLSLDGSRIESPADFFERVRASGIGDVMTLETTREGSPSAYRVKVTEERTAVSEDLR